MGRSALIEISSPDFQKISKIILAELTMLRPASTTAVFLISLSCVLGCGGGGAPTVTDPATSTVDTSAVDAARAKANNSYDGTVKSVPGEEALHGQ